MSEDKPIKEEDNNLGSEILEKKIQSELKTLKLEVDALQIQSAKERVPWYQNPPVIISFTALFFSALTTVFSTYINHENEIRNAKREVRSLLQQMARLPIENFELQNKYKNTPSWNVLYPNLLAENHLIVVQAMDIVKKHPKSFSGRDYMLITEAVLESGVNVDLKPLLDFGLSQAKENIRAYIQLTRTYGKYLFLSNQHELARGYFQKALDSWNLYPEDPFLQFKNNYDLYTFHYWAQSEISVGNNTEALKLLDRAEELVGLLKRPAVKIEAKKQINLLRFTARKLTQNTEEFFGDSVGQERK